MQYKQREFISLLLFYEDFLKRKPLSIFLSSVKIFPQTSLFQFFIIYFILMNIYIGNLSYNVKESDLIQVLEEYGTVNSVKLIKDRETGRSKGFAFAEMPDDMQAANTIKELNGAQYDNRTMVVKEARPRF